MPRAKRTPAQLDGLDALDALDQDPTPAPERRGPGRPRKATTAARGPGKIPARTSSGRVMSKSQMESKVEAELITYLSLAQAAWSIRDPECADVAGEQIPTIAARITAMIARNETALATLAKSGIIGDAIGLLSALLPIGKAVWAAHGPNGHHHGTAPQESLNEDDYPPYARRQ